MCGLGQAGDTTATADPGGRGRGMSSGGPANRSRPTHNTKPFFGGKMKFIEGKAQKFLTQPAARFPRKNGKIGKMGGNGGKCGKVVGNGGKCGDKGKFGEPASGYPTLLWVANNLQRNATHPLYGCTCSTGEKRQHCER